jgi:hypothetical protein
MQALGGAGQMTELSHGHEASQLVELHPGRSSTFRRKMVQCKHQFSIHPNLLWSWSERTI